MKVLEYDTKSQKDAAYGALSFALVGIIVGVWAYINNNIPFLVVACMCLLITEGEISRYIILREIRKKKDNK